MRDTVQIHVKAELPIRAKTLPFANRAEIRFGKAFPVAFLIDYEALPMFAAAVQSVHEEAAKAADRRSGEESS